ncbi:hypothetical protein YYC_05856 [Plasmodium yoelii 17X]|uniref:YIR protein n=1 Tax=Plasmodium yoelii 17X TaxID=1323249 RepID=V7P9C1_PLAYE|nr:hypothetical protein YYC_05856 [Plasmodium yoelii 17X]
MYDDDFKKHCTNGNCVDDTDKINARCLYIFDTFFKNDSGLENDAKGNIYIVQYILIWLSYVLSLIKINQDDNRTFFYNNYIEKHHTYKTKINGLTGYQNYKDLIDENNYILSMDKSIIYKLYDAFSTLCDIYIEFDPKDLNCEKSSEKIITLVKISAIFMY